MFGIKTIEIIIKYNQVCFIGLGYIGLPTATIVANASVKVQGVDVNKNVVDTVNQGKIHIIEPGLDDLVKTAVEREFICK